MKSVLDQRERLVIVDRKDVEPAVHVLDAVLIEVGARRVDNAFLFRLADGAERRAETAEGIILDLYEDQELSLPRHDVDLALLGVEVPLNYHVTFPDQVLFRDVLALLSYLIALQ